ncbi:LPS-assembly protein LptD [Novosphingobium flavum]|uniref:LPS-assembly protein LptD n=1 Tax=Novosphingobium flavum TaxID=1778672 RepID=A0A7X1FTC8_9SPHN|nr:LPS assembly protein LptD [Novosphingobium flavum]MBC2666616.1 LPS-assembly protein LptD [Novosphingobium flavum]
MPPVPETLLQTAPKAAGKPVRRRFLPTCALAAALFWALPAAAQDHPDQGDSPPGASKAAPGSQLISGPIAFEADEVAYAYNDEVVTATGNVVLRRDGQSVRADKVTWNRTTGQIEATGNIRLVDADGNQLFTDKVELTDELKAGAMQNLLLALRDGGRLAAFTGERDASGRLILTRAAFSGCPIEDEDGCPKNPTWQINATRVTYDPDRKSIHFTGARLHIFGVTLMPLPGLTIASDGRPINGLLIPDIEFNASNGAQISDAWYQRLGDNKDLTVTGTVFSKAPPMIAAQYRQLADKGAFQITGYATRSRLISVSGEANPGTAGEVAFRGYLYANGKFQFDPNWSLTGSLRLASDRTFLRRYGISMDDRLRSSFDLERVGDTSYFSISGWATQTMRVGDRQGLVPVALPVIDWRKRLADPVLGGKVELQLNSLAITRTAGQDTQRAFAQAQWNLTRLTPWGQVVSLTALGRGDIYHSDQNDLTTTATYQGLPGWQGRAIAIAAADVMWPLTGQVFGGTQVLTPRFQIVAAPPIRNLAVPNEDARAIDLEDSNLFALNRFPGYDRVEDGLRFTYGVDWQWQGRGIALNGTIGQSVRLSNQVTIVPEGTGLASRTSDIVGRTEVRFRDIVKFTHRYRLDKDNLAVRRNEIDATVGSSRTYVELGYLRLNRDITQVEDLQDREELRLAGRVAFARFWSVFASGIVNLTSQQEDPSSNSDGFQPLRTRLGIAYQDDCIEVAFTWRRDYQTTGDAAKGNSFQVHLALRNLGVR